MKTVYCDTEEQLDKLEEAPQELATQKPPDDHTTWADYSTACPRCGETAICYVGNLECAERGAGGHTKFVECILLTERPPHFGSPSRRLITCSTGETATVNLGTCRYAGKSGASPLRHAFRQ